MKKLIVLALAAVMVAALAMPASAIENKFGGFFDTEWVYYSHLKYQDTGANGNDYSTIRTRTRLYYTAVLSENLSFINKFELDTEWGQKTGYFNDAGKTTSAKSSYGGLGADGVALELKNTYVDFKVAGTRWEVGTQGFELHHGLLIADDASGLKLSYRGLDNVIPAFWWFRLNNGDKNNSDNGSDTDQYTLLANIKVSNLQIVPTISYLRTNNINGYNFSGFGAAGDEAKVWFAGLDIYMRSDMFNAMLTGIYEGGQLSDTVDIGAYAVNAKGDVKFGKFGVNAELLYTTGEKLNAAHQRSGDYGGFWYPEQNGTGANYTTAEFFRKSGATWLKYPISPSSLVAGAYNNTPDGNAVENRFEYGLGVDYAITKDVKAGLNWWNLNFTEKAASGHSDIGNEFDFDVNWKIMSNLQFDLMFNYLFYGSACKDVYTTNRADAGYELSGLLRLNF